MSNYSAGRRLDNLYDMVILLHEIFVLHWPQSLRHSALRIYDALLISFVTNSNLSLVTIINRQAYTRTMSDLLFCYFYLPKMLRCIIDQVWFGMINDDE